MTSCFLQPAGEEFAFPIAFTFADLNRYYLRTSSATTNPPTFHTHILYIVSTAQSHVALILYISGIFTLVEITDRLVLRCLDELRTIPQQKELTIYMKSHQSIVDDLISLSTRIAEDRAAAFKPLKPLYIGKNLEKAHVHLGPDIKVSDFVALRSPLSYKILLTLKSTTDHSRSPTYHTTSTSPNLVPQLGYLLSESVLYSHLGPSVLRPRARQNRK